ncbi:hypothetical protein DFJ63DRAFT_98982 [Scheffersomyces coipomensis]|uniref:uncharacterized protein n=1 Tax=Scheffersomyces coipomensis TaxID=1788519 RepID=UPI00315C733E
MSNRIVSHLDKENAVGRISKVEGKTFSNNAPLSGDSLKGNNLKQDKFPKKFTRVPLGGKSNNQAIPSFDKSHSTLSITDKKNLIRRVPLAKAPLLSKANSSLGFSHPLKEYKVIDPKLNTYSKIDDKVVLKKLNNELTSPSLNSVTTFTDEVVKKENLPTHQHIPNITSTLSSNTSKLNSTNRINNDINYNNVDPIKKSHKPSLSLPAVFPDYIETIPQKHAPLPSYPVGMEPLDQQDLDFFSKPSRSEITNENRQDYPELLHNEDQLKFVELNLDSNLSFDSFEQNISDADVDLQKDTGMSLGLSTKELEDLLD